MKMQITDLKPNSRVDWKVLQSGPDWEGTRITWDLTPDDKGTKILFGHRDWTITNGSYASVNYNWGYFLTSLKAYLETGKGTPDES